MKKQKTKANFQTDALNLAYYLTTNFPALTENIPQVNTKYVVGRKLQSYLEQNKHRIAENNLRGVVAVKDVWRNSTGGRIHLVPALDGPLGEAFEPRVVELPIDYEDKHAYFLEAVAAASNTTPPWAGNIHFHPMLCKLRGFQPATLLHSIQKEHGFQNEIQQLADAKLYILMPMAGQPYWRPANAEIIYNLFVKKADKK